MNSRNDVRNALSLKVKHMLDVVLILALFAAFVGVFAVHSAQAATFTVNNTNVGGAGTLRQAILDANNNPGADTIVFNIPGSGVKTIVLTVSLPSIVDPVFIDGWSQSSERGYTGPPLIEVTPHPSDPETGPGLVISTSNSTVRGLILNRFQAISPPNPFLPPIYGDGILISGDNNTIEGCYIGTTANGQGASPNEGDGISINGDDNLIGGITAGARNVISGNGANRGGIRISGADNSVIGNYIGIGANGFTDLGNSNYGIVITGDNNQIGGLPFGEITRGNVISGNGTSGIRIGDDGAAGNSNTIRGNNIGVGGNGSTVVGNNGDGIFIELGSNNQIGSGGSLLEPPGAGNTIRNNQSNGVRIGSGTGNRVSLNSINANGTLGIDLFDAGYGITLNDGCDLDAGVNKLQNFPVITSALSFGGDTIIEGTLKSIPDLDAPYSVEFFSSTTCDNSGHGEGRTYLGSRNVTISRPGCEGSFNATFSAPVVPGHFITATATDPDGNTSEFSLCRVVVASTLQFSAASYSVNENGGSATITVTRIGNLSTAANVNYAAFNGTATAGQDYVSTLGMLSFDVNEASKTFTVQILDDSDVEGNETVNLNLSNPTGSAGLGTPNSAVLTINDNDSSSAGLQYYALPTPVRLLDTRPGQLACVTPGAPLTGGGTRTEPARTACSGIPSSARVIVGNATVVNTESGATAGFITLYPSGAAQPNVSNLNYVAGQIVPNAFTVGLGSTDGAFNIYASSSTHFIVDITGYYAPPAPGGLYYHPLPSPVRLLDTRPGAPACDQPGTPLSGGASRTEPARVTCGGVTIPTSALVVVGNATVVNNVPGATDGYITLYPSGGALPTASNLNYIAGEVVPNAFTVGLGSTDGAFNIFASSATDFIVDITGYYSDQATDINGTGLLYYPLANPVRLLDTRPGQLACDAPGIPLTGGASRNQPARTSCSGVASSAQVVVGNATVVNNVPGATSGFITLYPSGAALPTVSNLNYVAGQVVANAFTVGLGSTDGAFNIYASSSTDFIADLTGYFAP